MTDYAYEDGAFCCVEIPDNPILIDISDGGMVSTIHPTTVFSTRSDAVSFLLGIDPDWIDPSIEPEEEPLD